VEDRQLLSVVAAAARAAVAAVLAVGPWFGVVEVSDRIDRSRRMYICVFGSRRRATDGGGRQPACLFVC